MKSISRIINRDGDKLLGLPNVISVGKSTKIKNKTDTGDPCITVYVTKKTAVQKKDRIPKTIDGVPTDVVCLPKARPMYSAHKLKRPFMGGDEIGPLGQESIGTIGMIFRARLKEGQGFKYSDFGLTNWHVVAAGGELINALGVKIVQPALSDFIHGTVVRQKAPDFRGETSYMDAALIRMTNNGGNPQKPEKGWNAKGSRWDPFIDRANERGSIGGAVFEGRMVGFPHYHKNFNGLMRDRGPWHWSGYRGTPHGFGVVEVGDKVWKAGSTTNITYGTVRATNLLTAVDYGSLGQATFRDQLLIVQDKDDSERNKDPSGRSRIILGGDSGSVLMDSSNYVTGLIFAGTRTYMVASPIQEVLQELFSADELFIYDINMEGV